MTDKKPRRKADPLILERRSGYIFGVHKGEVKKYWIDAPKNEARAQAWAPNATLPPKPKA